MFSTLQQEWVLAVPLSQGATRAQEVLGGPTFILYTCRREVRFAQVDDWPHPWLVVTSEDGTAVEFDLQKRTEPLAVLVREAIEQ